MGLVRTFLSRYFFYFLRWMCHMLQTTIHKLNGVESYRAKVHQGGVCLSEAEVFSVIWRQPTPMLFGLQDETYYMLWHQKFECLDYLLNEDVTLYSIDGEYAYFVKTPKDLDIYNTEKHPFMFKAQQYYGTEVIVVTLDKICALSKRIGNSPRRVDFLVHSTRCGSTALCQVFNTLPGWTALAETCFPLKYMYDMRYKHGRSATDVANCEKFHDIAEACVRIYTKDFAPEEKVMFKAIGLSEVCLIPFISKRFPESYIISAHRNGLGTAKSSYQVFYDVAFNMTVPTLWNRLVSYKLFWGDISRMIFMVTSGMGEEFEQIVMSGKYTDCFYLHYIRWVTNSLLYLKFYKQANSGKLICANYEDLVADKHNYLSQILNSLEISSDHMKLALKALDFDSQKNSVISYSARKERPVWSYNQSTVDQIQAVLDKYELPKFDQKFRFCSKDGIKLNDSTNQSAPSY